MSKVQITLTVDSALLKDSQERLAEQGLTLEDAMESLLERIAGEGKLPFEIHPRTQPTREELLSQLYGEEPTKDAKDSAGLLEPEEEPPFLFENPFRPDP